jgi:predicted acylesterase/phospholipase RssA
MDWTDWTERMAGLAGWWARGWANRGERRGGADHSEGGPETAFVLLGGAARGAAQAGALTVLLERGIVPDLIIGISAGAWNGAYIAQEPKAERARELEALWRATTNQEIRGPHWRRATHFIGSRASLASGDGVRRVARRYLADHTFEELRVPLRVVATDLALGEPVFFEHGSLEHAVLASSAIPGFFPPVLDGDRVLTDGGSVEWAGCLAAVEAGARRIVLLGCGSVVSATSKWRMFLHVWERSKDIEMRDSFACIVSALRGTGREVLSIFPELPGGTRIDFDRAPSLIQAGRTAAERAIAAWEAERPLVSPAPRRLRVQKYSA